MKKFLVYLAGPISGSSFIEANNWRKVAKDNFSECIETISPLRGKQRVEISKDEVIKDVYEKNPLTSSKGILTRDFNDVKRADALLVNFLKTKKPSFGTVMEIAWAKVFNIPVVLIINEEDIHNHAMILGCCGFIVESLEHGIEIIESILLTDKQLDKV